MIMKLRMIKIICCLLLITISLARGQTSSGSPSDSYLILYRLDRSPGRYVLSMSRDTPEKGKFSTTVVVGDTFSVQPSGEVCFVIMSNAYVLQTTFGHSSSNQVAQTTFRAVAWKWNFPKHTKLVFNDSVAELPKAKFEALGEANMKTYEGDDALRQLKKIGLKPPDDMDTDKAVGHK
jgi:hypothetical protein